MSRHRELRRDRQNFSFSNCLPDEYASLYLYDYDHGHDDDLYDHLDDGLNYDLNYSYNYDYNYDYDCDYDYDYGLSNQPCFLTVDPFCSYSF